MSMLAERKQKQKWSLNPRGKEWSEDTSKFGFKMLEKMGWSKGKGLGANENGITEHVKVSYKADSKGLGFKEDNEQWTKHDVEFNSLLQTLTTNSNKNEQVDFTSEIVRVKSLEKKSRKSRVRVHYHKFTRGKDLSRYSAKDLANIFGKKAITKSNGVIEVQNQHQEENSLEIINNNLNGDFNEPKKKKSKKSKNEDLGINNLAFNPFSNEIDPESNQISDKNSVEILANNNLDEDVNEPKRKKSTKGRSEDLGINPAFSSFSNETSLENNQTAEKNSLEVINNFSGDINEPKKKKLKKKKKNEDLGINNLAFDLFHNTSSIEPRIVENETIEATQLQNTKKKLKINDEEESEIGEEGEPISRKKKKSKKGKENFEVSNICEEIDVDENEITDIKVKEKQKKSKKSEVENLGIINPAFNQISNESILENNVMEVKVIKEKNKKSKKSKEEDLGINNLAFNLFSNEIDFEGNQISEKNSLEILANNNLDEDVNKAKKKKSKKNKNEDLGINPAFSSFSNETSLENNQIAEENSLEVINNVNRGISEPKKKKLKKKKNEDLGINNLAFDFFFNTNPIEPSLVENETIEATQLQNAQKESKEKKKKSKKSEVENLEINNPAFNPISNESVFENNVMEVEVVKEKKKKSKKSKQQDLGLSNPAFNPLINKENGEVLEKVESSREKDLECDITLNITTTPIIKTQTAKASNISVDSSKKSGKKRKSVRFSNVTQEHIIPSNYELRLEQKESHDIVEENVNSLSKKIDGCQAELENDINEAKDNEIMIGIVGSSDGENEKLDNGTLLKFKHASFGKCSVWKNNSVGPEAKRSYKHLIKGDIMVAFKNTNLHAIKGYAVEKKSNL